MGRTGHKGITTRYLHGVFSGLNVQVAWNGRTLATVVSCENEQKGMDKALEIREKFESELGKPRTERRIRSGQGAPYVRGGDVVVSLGSEGERTFSIAKYGLDEAMSLAEDARLLWVVAGS